MITGARLDTVGRWPRRPMWWALVGAAIAVAFVAADAVSTRSAQRTGDEGYRAIGRIVAVPDSGQHVEVSYVHPATGEEVHTSIHGRDAGLPDHAGPVRLTVSKDDPADLGVASQRASATTNLPGYLPLVLVPLAVWGTRRWTLARSRRLASSDSPAYLMRAAASPPTAWGRRWSLHLYPLDAGPAARPVCVVPLVAPVNAGRVIDVVVKGSPRPFARVVARDLDGNVLWPSGRALRTQGRPVADVTSPRPGPAPKIVRAAFVLGAVILVAGVIGASVGTFADDVRARAVETLATVTSTTRRSDGLVTTAVEYRWGGRSYAGTVTRNEVVPADSRLVVRVDPESPSRVWTAAQAVPPGSTEGELAGVAILGGLGLLLAAGAMRRRARWREPSGWPAQPRPLPEVDACGGPAA